jgi:hypothetical protein
MNMNYSKVFELLNQDVEKEERNKMTEKAVYDNLYNKGFRDGLSVLDKIRTEIEEHVKINQNLNTDRVKALCWCLDVIGKYKAESEDKE